MAFLFREIRNKSLWDKSDDLPWLPEGELVADVFKALGTSNGDLSTYAVDDDKSNVHRVVAAFACTRDNFQRVDYVLIPFDAVDGAFGLKKTPGATADAGVNDWHYDIIELTSQKLLNLAYLIQSFKQTMKRMPKKTVKIAVNVGIKRGNIDRNRVNRKLIDKIDG